MDHVNLPASTQHPRIVVKYLCSTKYDSGPFLSYPERCGWSQADILFRPNWTNRPPNARQDAVGAKSEEAATSFLQNWLYFGLLRDVLGPTVQDDEFIRVKEDSLEKFITTEKLLYHVGHAITRWHGLSTEDLRSEMALIDQVLIRTRQVYEFVCHDTTLDPSMLFSIAVLGDFLTYIRNAALWAGKSHSHELILHWPSGDREMNVIATRMLARGWCVSHVIRALRLSPSGRYFVSQLEAPKSEKPHTSCSKFRCRGYELDWDTYETCHVQDGCKCDFLSAAVHDLTAALERDEIPLISTPDLIASEFSGPIPLVSHRSNGSSYVAISHVWSDHRGNPRANGLPTCQLQYLVDCVQKLFPDRPMSKLPEIWIDTICCPVEPRWARDKAIVLMRETYSAADKVLVIEDYIRQCSFPADTMFEPFARIYLSTWTTRLWTLQEGILAKRLFFQFANAAINFEEAWQALLQGREALLEVHNNLTWPVNIRGGFSDEKSVRPFNSVFFLSIAVYERFTSWATDEPLCLGTLMGIDMEKMLNGPVHSRMHRFWSLLPHIPAYVIFWTGQRLSSTAGLGWAPATLLNSRLDMFPGSHSEDAQGTLSDQGLHVCFPGVLLTSVSYSRINRRFWLRDANGRFRYWFRSMQERNDEHEREHDHTSSSTMLAISEGEEQSTSQSQPLSIDLAIITAQPLALSTNTGTGEKNIVPVPDPVPEVLVKILRHVDSTLHVSVVKTGTVFTASSDAIPAVDHTEAAIQTEIIIKHDDKKLKTGPAMKKPRANEAETHDKLPTAGLLRTAFDRESEVSGYGYKYEYQAPEAKDELGPGQKWCVN